MSSYQEHALEGASAVDLVVALYDGILRFLYTAMAAVDRGDAVGRRMAVKRALDIIIHLQARLRMDVGGRPAQVLSEFYASIFAQILQASQSASRPEVRARHRMRAQCARRVAPGGEGPQCGSRSAADWRRCRQAAGRQAWKAPIPLRMRLPARTGRLEWRCSPGAPSMDLALLRSLHPATVSSSSSCCFW